MKTLDLKPILDRVRHSGPDRIVINVQLDGVAPAHTTVRADVIFVRKDGWTLGAPRDLARATFELYRGDWVAVVQRRGSNYPMRPFRWATGVMW